MRSIKLKIGGWAPKIGGGWEISYRLVRINALLFTTEILLAWVAAVLFYTPALFLQRLVKYLESDPERKDRSWGWFFCIGLVLSTIFLRLGKYPSVSLYSSGG